jgi:ribose 5-phosphate isomerase B
MKKIVIASDHAGFLLKEKLKKYLNSKGYSVKDFGTSSLDSCDYPDYAIPLAKAIAQKRFNRGILICKSGIGNSIVANRFKGVRAALSYNKLAAQLSREHNDSNVLVLGSGFVTTAQAKTILNTWLKTEFQGGRHIRRLNKINGIDGQLRSCR